jgi:hypothetical protein
MRSQTTVLRHIRMARSTAPKEDPVKKRLPNGRVRLQGHIDWPLARRLEAFGAASAVTESAVIQAARHHYLDRPRASP